jgi:tetratricopeptide (TPR) repeat protein
MVEWHSFPVPAAGTENGRASEEAQHAEDIHRRLDRICASCAFRGSLRLTRFLRFIVETTLAGKSDTIKAYTIAVEALGRGGNFDPQSDPIVRVEAGRLRQALARYYAGPGQEDIIVLDLPRGTYVPVFHLAGASKDAPPAPAVHERGTPPQGRNDAQSLDADAVGEQANFDLLPEQHEQSTEQLRAAPDNREIGPVIDSAIGRISAARIFRIAFCAVAILAILQALFDIGQPFTGGANEGLLFKLLPMHSAVAAQSPTVTGEPIVFVEPVLAFGDRPPDLASPGMIRERLFDALARFDEVTVVPGPPHEGPGSPSASESGPNSKAQPPYYRLSSTVSYYPESVFTLAVRVIDTADGTVAWTNSYDRLPEQGRHEGHISSDVARTLFQPFGIIQAREAIKRAAADPMRDPYRCILDANVYLRSFDPSLYGSTRGCLERATANNPPFVGVFVKLARLYFRDYQIGASGQAGDRATLDRAYRMAARAIDINPNSAAAQFAMGEILLARGDFEQAKVAEDNALRLNPYDNAVIYGDAALLILTGQLDEGLAVLRQNTNKKTAVWAGHHFLVALGSYLKGNITTAAIEAGQIANANFPPGLVLDAIIAANNKDRPRARYDIALLYGKNPTWRNDPRANIGYFLPDRDMANRIGEDFAAVTDDLKKHADVVGSVAPAARP